MVCYSLNSGKAHNNLHLVVKIVLYNPYLETYFLLLVMVYSGGLEKNSPFMYQSSTPSTIPRILEQNNGKPFQKSKLQVTNQMYFTFNTM